MREQRYTKSFPIIKPAGERPAKITAQLRQIISGRGFEIVESTDNYELYKHVNPRCIIEVKIPSQGAREIDGSSGYKVFLSYNIVGECREFVSMINSAIKSGFYGEIGAARTDEFRRIEQWLSEDDTNNICDLEDHHGNI